MLKMLPTLQKLRMLSKLLTLSWPARLPVLMSARLRLRVERLDLRMADPFLSRCLAPSPRENTLAPEPPTSPPHRPCVLPSSAWLERYLNLYALPGEQGAEC